MDQTTEHHLREPDAAFAVMAGLLVTFYLTANIMATRIIAVGGHTLFDAGTVTFPMTFVLGDTLTEVWGYKASRKVILLAFACNIILTASTWIGTTFPAPAYNMGNAEAYDTLFTYVPRIVAASLTAFLIGELTNAKLMDILRSATSGRHLWLRAITGSAAGYAADTVVFTLLAFAAVVPMQNLVPMILWLYATKLLIDICCTPCTYWLVRRLSKTSA